MIYFEPRHIDLFTLLPSPRQIGNGTALAARVARIRQQARAMFAPTTHHAPDHVDAAPATTKRSWGALIRSAFASMPSGGTELRHGGMVGAIRERKHS